MSMGKGSEQIYSEALEVGEERLSNLSYETAISAFIAGMYVTFGGLAALEVTAIIADVTGDHNFGWIVGSTLYPIGFIFVVVGKSELFTENFMTPVLALWEKKGTFRDLFRLWGMAVLFNLVGVFVITYVIGHTGILSGEMPGRELVIEEFYWVADHALHESLWTFFWKSVIAGLLINFMSWLVIASEEGLPKIAMIWIPCFLIMVLGTHHCIVGSSEILLAINHGYDASYVDWFLHYFLPAVVGNGLGGIVFVASVHYIQFRTLKGS